MNRWRVVLYGNSVVLGALKASLERYAELEIIPLSSSIPRAEELGALAPDVIIFDTGSAQPAPIFNLLRELPDLLLVGVDPELADLALWTGKQNQAVSAEDLVQTIAAARSRRSMSE